MYSQDFSLFCLCCGFSSYAKENRCNHFFKLIDVLWTHSWACPRGKHVDCPQHGCLGCRVSLLSPGRRLAEAVVCGSGLPPGPPEEGSAPADSVSTAALSGQLGPEPVRYSVEWACESMMHARPGRETYPTQGQAMALKAWRALLLWLFPPLLGARAAGGLPVLSPGDEVQECLRGQAASRQDAGPCVWKHRGCVLSCAWFPLLEWRKEDNSNLPAERPCPKRAAVSKLQPSGAVSQAHLPWSLALSALIAARSSLHCNQPGCSPSSVRFSLYRLQRFP